MKSILITADYQLTVPASRNEETIYMGEFVSVNGFPLFMGEKEFGPGPKHILLPAGRDTETSELYVSLSYPANQNKKHGSLERQLAIF